MSEFPAYVSRQLVADRLPLIFPDGTQNRNYCVRDLAAATVFTALYIGAVEGSGIYLGPAHVYRMTSEQAAETSDEARRSYQQDVLKKNRQITGKRWYADNTREPIRDETLRDGLVTIGAVTSRNDLPTTSSKPRYALKADFAELFNPALEAEMLEEKILAFQAKHLSASALARLSIIRAGAIGSTTGVLVNFPSGETRRLAPGPSSAIAQAVIEVFATHFLQKPAVIWLSESGNKVVVRDDKLARSIGVEIDVSANLPDIILADLGPEDPLIVFVEVVATDGAITARRQEAILALTTTAGFKNSQIAFVTAYQDRESAGFKKTLPQLAWDSFAWFASEPDNILIMRRSGEVSTPLFELARR